MAKRLSKIIFFHQGIHAKTYNDRYSKPQQKHRLGTVSKILLEGSGLGDAKSILRGHTLTLALRSAVAYTRHLFSTREGFNISENIKIKRIQRWNKDEAKENQQHESEGHDQSQSIRHQLTYLKVFRPEPS